MPILLPAPPLPLREESEGKASPLPQAPPPPTVELESAEDATETEEEILPFRRDKPGAALGEVERDTPSHFDKDDEEEGMGAWE